jgi:hypothetical protein
VLFVWIARLTLLDVLDVIWELNALIGAGEGCGIERVRFGSAPRFTLVLWSAGLTVSICALWKAPR